jgi:Cytochrome c552
VAERPHHVVAVCSDCHTPHNVLGKYAVKASNGFRHSFYFTSGRYPDSLLITPGSARVTESACRSCHSEIQGIHARSGVACADCHMPYKREGALKISDHHVRSPLLNINRACQTCHRWPEEELKARVDRPWTR